MNAETDFKRDWHLMFSDVNLDGIIAQNAELFRNDSIDRSRFCHYVQEDRESFDQRFVSDVFTDFLFTCGSSPATGVRFSKAELKAALKGLGVPGEQIGNDGTELRIKLKNAVFIFSRDCGARVSLSDRLRPVGGFIKIGFLGARGFAEFIMNFDTVVPRLRQSIDEIYMEVKKYNDSQRMKSSKIGKMVEIALKGKGIDYEYELAGDRVHLKFERIVYTRVEEDVDFGDLAEYLCRVPQIVQATVPKVTEGRDMSMDTEPVSFGRSRDKVYDRLLVEGEEKEQ